MESLYRKYRPQTFDDVVGQQHIVGTLKRAVQEGRISHAYLFCGPRGTGKTTLARILAKSLLCERGPGQLPDGTCEQCELIAAGEHPDVYEMDAASRTGVDNVREEIITRVDYAPVRGRYKVYIIDEAHMLSQAAWNALLKTLEEPPAHVVFILCTTDPQRIIPTVLSRVQRFDFHPLTDAEIAGQLRTICEQEGFTYDDAAIDIVCQHARGGMRDAITTLEQLSVFGDGIISADAARDLLGEASRTTLSEATRAIAGRDVATLFGLVAQVVNSGRDLLQLTRELAAYVRDVYVVSVVGDAEGVVHETGEALEQLRQEAALFGSTDRIARVLSILGDASAQMTTAPNQRLVLEIAFTRAARPGADLTLESLAERVEALEHAQVASPAAPAAPRAPEAPRASAPKPQPTAAPAPAATSAPAATPAPTPTPAAPAPKTAVAPEPVTAEAPAPAPEPAPASAPAPAPTAPAASAASASALQRKWREATQSVLDADPSRGAFLMNAIALSDDGKVLKVGLPEKSSFAMHMLSRTDTRAVMDPIIGQVFGPRRIEYVEGGASASAGDPPADPAPAPAAAPAPAPEPAPIPQPAPSPAPAPQPAPVPSPAPSPEPGFAENPMASDGYPSDVPSDYVPDEAFEPAPPAEPAPAPVAQAQAQIDTPAARVDESRGVPGEPAAPDPQAEAPAAEAPETADPSADDAEVSESVLLMLEDVFGPGIKQDVLHRAEPATEDEADETVPDEEGLDGGIEGIEEMEDDDDDGDD